MFDRRGGKPIRYFYDAWNAACEAAGVPETLFHDLRRTGARNLIRAGVPQKMAMKLISHKTRSMFDRHNIVDGADLWDGVAKLAEYLQAREQAPRTVVPLRERGGVTAQSWHSRREWTREGVAAERKSG